MLMLTAVECVVHDGSKFLHWKKMKSNSKTVPYFLVVFLKIISDPK